MHEGFEWFQVVEGVPRFTICIFCAMCNVSTSSSEGRLVFCWSCLLMALLFSWSSFSRWSFVGGRSLLHSSLFYSSFWSFDSQSFCCSNCCSNSWFHWVSHSTAVVRVCIYLSNALDGFLISWLVVAIVCVWTIQLFVFETAIRFITRFPQTAPTDDTQKSSVSWSSTHVPMGVPEEQKRRTNQRASVVYQPKNL